MTIDPASPPTLIAVPVKASDAALSDGNLLCLGNLNRWITNESDTHIITATVALAAVLLMPHAQAADNLHFYGNLLSKSCTLVIQGESLAEVHFPTVSRKDLMVTGQSARVPVVFQLKDCKGPARV